MQMLTILQRLTTMDNAAQQQPYNRQIGLWLISVCLLIYAMVILGGVTRLTGSGLSMVDWDPLMGWIPPMTQMQWEHIFELYRSSPEYQKINIGMDLDGFKSIFWLEFLHRVLGRLIGLSFLLPFLYFYFSGKIARQSAPKFILMFLLGGLQGVLGWYMVKSGLVDNPHVSQYRLTAHLAAAFLIYAYLFWTALGYLIPKERLTVGAAYAPRLYKGSYGLTVLITITILSGGFVAGLKAGYGYNTFPDMNGQYIPPGLFTQNPFWINFFENRTTVQFDHRVLAITTWLAVTLFWWRYRTETLSHYAQLGMNALLGMVWIQVALGISTLLLVVPTALASIHQAGAVALFTIILFMTYIGYQEREAAIAE